MSHLDSRARARRAALLSIGAAVLAAAGCAKPGPLAPEATVLGPAQYADPTVEKPKIRWGAGPTSLNDRCIVRKSKLNLRMPPIFVNGQPIGFC